MGGGDNGCGIGLLGVTSNKSSYIPQTEQHSPFGLVLLHLGNVTIMCVCVCVCVCMYVCMFACLPLALLAITLGWQQQLSRDVL